MPKFLAMLIAIVTPTFFSSNFALAQRMRPPAKEKDTEPEEVGFAVAFAMPIKFRYLDQASVRDELKLTKEQIDKITKLKATWREGARKNGAIDEDELAKQFAQRVPKQIDETLSADQRLRLRQIMLRHREREFGLSAVLGTVANDLSLTPQQRERFEKMQRKRAEVVLEHLTSGERFSDIRVKVFQSNNDYFDQFKQLLSDEQRNKLNALLGQPFKGEIHLEHQYVPPPKPVSAIYHEKLFGIYMFEAQFLINESVQKELRMGDDQIRKAKEFHVEWSKQFEDEKKKQPDLVDVYKALDLTVAHEIKLILDKRGQRERFISIMMRHRLEVGGPAAACGYPELGDALSLTPGQTEKLRLGSLPNVILDGPQKEIYKKILGQPFKMEGRIEDPFAVVKKVDAPAVKVPLVPVIDERRLNLAGHMIDRAKQLKLTDEQVARLKEIAEDAPKLKALLQRELSSLPPSTDLAILRNGPAEAHAADQFRQAVVEQCLEVLDKKQRSLHGQALKEAASRY